MWEVYESWATHIEHLKWMKENKKEEVRREMEML